MVGAIVYDIETYPNCFLFGAVDYFDSANRVMFEISEYVDQSADFLQFLWEVNKSYCEMYGFNNLGFDYPVIHDLFNNQSDCTFERAYAKATAIIHSDSRWGHTIWASDRFFPQIDLYKVNHFDNFAKSTSLKELQFTMRSPSVEDLPIPPGTHLTRDEVKTTTEYCFHDIDETRRFAHFCKPDIDFRRDLVDRFGPEVLNWAEIKIGSELLIADIGKRNCYTWEEGSRYPKQTYRDNIPVADILFPYITFRRPESQLLHERIKKLTIYNTRDDLHESVTLDGFQFDLGTGGIHASQRNTAFHADDEHDIIDVDVTSLYPHIVVVNQLAPEHLGQKFIDEYSRTLETRKAIKEKNFKKRALKYVLNGVYGNSNNEWSPFYDPKLTMAVTINGQCLLLMLAEALMDVPTVEMIQANTDGITFRIKKAHRDEAMAQCTAWEQAVLLPLEFQDYTSFHCRDVNNYLAVTPDGKTKAKGAYAWPKTWEDYEGWWFRNYSALIIPMAAEHELTGKGSAADFIRGHKDPFDFMLRYKTPGGSKLMFDGVGQQKVTRYYASTDGGHLFKESPPPPGAKPGDYKRKAKIGDQFYRAVLSEIPPGTWDERIHTKNKSKYGERKINVHQRCSICNDASVFRFDNLDHDWYIGETMKLIDIFKIGGGKQTA